MRISDWSSDVCSSDLAEERVIQVVEGRRLEAGGVVRGEAEVAGEGQAPADAAGGVAAELLVVVVAHAGLQPVRAEAALVLGEYAGVVALGDIKLGVAFHRVALPVGAGAEQVARVEPEVRSEEHTSELPSLMRISYAGFCLKKKTITTKHTQAVLCLEQDYML